ncbi:MAG: SIS domain-containing protein [Armatimonadetes bacterium]|nr:SIS domain-containing protein [Armatimonadota bacterium]
MSVEVDTIRQNIQSYLSGVQEVFSRLPLDEIQKAAREILRAFDEGKTVFTMGNGGHGSTAAHNVNDLQKHLVSSDDRDEIVVKGRRLRAMCLCDSISTLTGWANDAGYENAFAEQLKNWVQPGDVVIGITGSGNSQNIINAYKLAKEVGAVTITFGGAKKGNDEPYTDIYINVPTPNILWVEDVHMALAHLLTSVVREEVQRKYE